MLSVWFVRDPEVVAERQISIFRNALGYRPITRFFATRSFLSLQSVPIASVSFDGFSPDIRRNPNKTVLFEWLLVSSVLEKDQGLSI